MDNAVVVAKVVVEQSTTVKYAHNYEQTDVVLKPRGEGTLPEDKKFHEATPNGKIELTITNKSVIEKLPPGKVFYMYLVPADELSPMHT